MLESLEGRRLLSATLTINGTDLADRIGIFRTDEGLLVIDHLAGNIDPQSGEFIPVMAIDYRDFPADEIRLIVVRGGAGDDVIDVSEAGVSAWLDGGAGDDVLIGSARSDALSGGAGDDELHGGAGKDALFGGDGDDELYGDDGSDLLSGGRGNDLLDGGQDKSRDLYDGGQGNDRAVARSKPLAVVRVERVTNS